MMLEDPTKCTDGSDHDLGPVRARALGMPPGMRLEMRGCVKCGSMSLEGSAADLLLELVSSSRGSGPVA